MNLKHTNKQNLQWDVDRYLLLDPSFDRDAFEQRMFEDVELAEMVAGSVADLHAISAAARLSDKVTSSTSSTSEALGCRNSEPTALAAGLEVVVHHERQSNLSARSQRRAYWAISVTAALLLLTVSVWKLGGTSNEEQLSQIADNWAAFEGLTTGETLELIANDDPATETQNDAEASEQTDWLVEAAREFYLAKNDGAAG